MRITPIFDRPKKYYGINKVYITPTEYLPDNYESNPQVPSKFIIEQHPEGNKFFDITTYSNSYNSEVGVEYPYGHLFGKYNKFPQHFRRRYFLYLVSKTVFFLS